MNKPLNFYKENIQSLSFTGISTDEQETVIIFGRNSDMASVETTDSTVLTKLKKCADTSPDEWVLTNVTTSPFESDPTKITSICFKCPKKLVSEIYSILLAVQTSESIVGTSMWSCAVLIFFVSPNAPHALRNFCPLFICQFSWSGRF